MEGHVDVNSIVVARQDRVRGGEEVACQASEGLESSNRGAVSWLFKSRRERIFYVYFDILEDGRRPFRDYREPVGLGDAVFYNRPNGFDPLGVGMTNDQPLPVDWDGDGRVDLLTRNIWSSAYGEPYWGLFFWRNIGSNAEPKFDRYLRLRADGRLLQDHYAGYQLIDWNNDGNTDVLCGTWGGPKVFLNTGKKDAWGLPVLTSGPEVPLSGGGELWYGMRVRDWTGGNRPDLFTLHMVTEYTPVAIVSNTLFRHPNLARPGRQPRYGPGEAIPLAGSTQYQDRPNTSFDWDGDGDLDLLGYTDDLQASPAHPGVVVWENTGTREAPQFTKPASKVPEFEGIEWVTAANDEAFQGLLAPWMSAWLKYYKQTAKTGPARFDYKGMLLARGQPVSVGGYNCAEVEDWEGDGDLDFICGNERGYLFLVENVSREGRTMFATARPILGADGEQIHVARWMFINDHDPEWNCGQTKPCYADWDGDGDLDLLVGNNSNRIAYFENIGTRAEPKFAPMTRLTHGDNDECFGFRSRPIAVNWNGDGLLDLVESYQGVTDKSSSPRVTCLFLRYRDADGKLRLADGIALKTQDGGTTGAPTEAADWDGDGDYDLFTNEDHQVFLYLNEGSNAEPIFKRTQVCVYGSPICIGYHETMAHATDWDHDGTLDLLAGAESGWVYFFRRAALDAGEEPASVRGRVETRSQQGPA